jgi:translation initiation factor eIF-2B subunit delta
VEVGIPCSYILITALSHIIHDCTKCFLGAHGLLSNGAVVSRTGMFDSDLLLLFLVI